MSKFPSDFDDDTTLPFINDNLNDIGGEAINALRDVAFALEQNIGLGAAGTTNSIADRLGVSINPNGTIKASAIASLGLVTLPIRQDQIADDAEIPESKLRLDHRTQDLFNYIRDLSGDVNLALGWISVSGVKLEPHLIGAIYRHTMDQIDVTGDPIGFPFLKNKFRQFRNNLQSYNLVNDINNELLAHQWADGSNFTTGTVVTNNGSLFSANYGHTASGIFLNTTRFVNIPQIADDLQLFAEFIDESSILLLGTRIQNLYSNGISRVSRSSSLSIDGYGQSIIPMTPAIAYLKNIGSNSTPFDDIDRGDDIIEFKPLAAAKTSKSFDEQFALVKVGDIIRINYGTIETSFIIKEKKYIAASQKYLVRIAGKNLFYSPIAVARIDRPLVNNNKFGVLAIAPANNQFNQIPSLVVGSPRGAQALGVGFSSDEFNETHYLLYLALYPTGSPQDGYTILPGIDVTGNRGQTPGAYTLDSIVDATNAALRKPGFNYRFIAFSYQGEFGIMLADPYSDTAFSVLSAVVKPDGTFDAVATGIVFQNNVVDLFPVPPHTVAPDPLGFGPFGANIASPPFMLSYGSTEASQNPTRLFVPLKRNNYYVNGAEKERLNLQPGQALDGYGDGYWVGTIQVPLPVTGGRVEKVYRVAQDLSTSDLKIGKTLVVQSLGAGSLLDFGRFIIKDINFGCNPANFTDITVYDAVHAQGFSPTPTLGSDGNPANVALYFNSDSVSFNAETATDFVAVSPFKRHFEVYIDQFSNTFTHERGRMGISGSNIVIDTPTPVTLYGSTQPAKLDIIKISPKLRGYQFGPVTKINLNIIAFDSASGIYDGYLSSFDGSFHTHLGPTINGKKGEVTRFYDETNIDYIDVLFDITTIVGSFALQNIDIQLFPTLSLDDEVMLIGTCQLNDTTKFVNRVRDERQFGNTSEKELSTSALNFIALPERLLHFNGVIRGFDIVDVNAEVITLTGGQALVNGKFQLLNNEILTIPFTRELYFSVDFPINWALCINSIGELVTIPLTDFDSVLGTPNDPTRLVVLKNVISNTTYTVDSTTFANLLNNRKDLTILYIVASTVSMTPTVSLSVKDVRRYVNDQDSNIPAVVTDDNSQGNFKNFVSAATWIKLDNKFQNTIQIKGSQFATVDPGFSAGNSVNIVGGGVGAILTFNTNVVMFNVNFKDLEIHFLGNTTLTNVNFDNCVVYNGGPSHNFTATNCILNRCTITVDGTATLTNVLINKSTATFESTIIANTTRFTDSILTFLIGGTFTNVIIDPSTITIGGTITINSSATITDSTILVTTVQAFVISNLFRFERNQVTYTGAPGGGYDTTDLVNAGGGMIYASVGANLSDVIVRDNTFTTALTDRFSFFSLQLTSFSSVIENIDVSKNKFISTAMVDDLRAVISIVSTLTAPASPGAYPRSPKLVNVFIDGNMCNANQMIVVSVQRTPGVVAITGGMLTTTSTKISNNTCGTIGFITAAASASDFSNVTSPNIGLIQDKSDQLVISGNACKFIANLDFRGDYIPFRSTAYPGNNIDFVATGTGAFSIYNNTVNWIQVGCSAYTVLNDGGIITSNRVSPANPAYLNNFTDALVSGVTPGNVGILLRREFNGTGTTRSIIANNIIVQKNLFNTVGTAVSYYYDAALVCFNSANITGNSIIGVVNTLTNPLSPFSTILYLGPSGNMIVSGNNLDRAGLGIQSYVATAPGAVNQVSVTNNIFDSQFIDVANTIETVGVNIPSAWSFRNNRNQIFYKEISLVDDSFGLDGLFGAGVQNNSYPAHTQLTLFADQRTGADGFITVFRQIGPASYTEIASDHFIQVQDFGQGASHTFGWTKRGAIDPYLPDNVRILNARIGYFESTWNSVNALDYNAAPAYNVATLTMFRYKDSTTSNDPLNGVLNVRDQITAHAGSFGNDNSVFDNVAASHHITSAGDETNIRTNTVIITADLTAHDFTTNQNYRIGYSLEQNFKKAAPTDGNFVFFDWSPIVLKCIYR
jgi:hypothetical protein